jgi:chorismate dehydratase
MISIFCRDGIVRIRISLVHYLNAAPLGWSFLHGPLANEVEVIPSSPARCAEQLARGEVEAGLIPSIEYQRIPGLQIVPGMAIAAVTTVRSVLMVRRRGAGAISSVALDTSSRTSATLLRVLLNRKMGLNPEFVAHEPDLPAMLRRCDTALLIGDAALQFPVEDYEVTDLAESWIAWQQKPFVFAFWVCRRDLECPDQLVDLFQRAKAWGLERRREIAENYALSLSLPAHFLEAYLWHNIDYGLGPDHVAGLEKFYALAHDVGLLTQLRPIRFAPVFPGETRQSG